MERRVGREVDLKVDLLSIRDDAVDERPKALQRCVLQVAGDNAHRWRFQPGANLNDLLEVPSTHGRHSKTLVLDRLDETPLLQVQHRLTYRRRRYRELHREH